MKKIIAITGMAGLICFAAGAQKTINDPNAEKRNVSGYHAVKVGGGIDLYLSAGDESVAVSASDAKYRDRIRTEVEDGVLKIYYKDENGLHFDWGSNRKLKAYVSYRALDLLVGSGGSDIFVDGSIRGKTLDLQVSGGSDFSGRVEVDDLKLGASGGSDIMISGKAGKTTINANGGSDIKGYDLSADICKADASGGSDIFITVNQELTASSSGGSDVHFKGNASVRELKSNGSGGIRKTGSK